MKRSLTFFFTSLFLTVNTSLAIAQNAYFADVPLNDLPVEVDGGWHQFTWFGAPGVFSSQGAWTFSSAFPTELKITDVGVVGDQFTLYDAGLLIGTTSSVANSGFDDETLTPDKYFADPRYSHGVFQLAPGSHSITIQTVVEATGFESGGAYFRVDVVPEPGTLALAGLCCLMGLVARHRRS